MNAMYMDEERVELGDHHGKKKGKRREGKSKGESGRRRDKEAMKIESAADIPENGEEEAVIGISKEKEGHMRKKEKGRRKEKDRINGSFDSGSTDHVVGKEEAKNLASSVHAEGDRSKDGVKKDKKNKEKKEKKKEKEAEMIGQKQTLTVQNLGSEYADRDKVGEKQSSTSKQATGSKKSKQKHMVSDQIVTREDKKRKKEHAVVLEESSEIRNTETGDNRESKKKRGKKIDKVSSDLCKNASAGGEEIDVDGTNHKEEKKGKEIAGGKREKEKEAHSKDKGKRVSFADAAEVFTIEGGDDEEGGSSGESKLVHGQRFTQEEDETLMEAIRNYAEMKQLGEKGLEMIRSCSKHPELKGCWNDIAKSLPHRPRMAIYSRAQILLYRSAERKWTEEEKGKIRWFVETNGTDWKKLADELGKSAIHVKDTWRRIKPKNLRKGTWTQEEQQNLFDLVHLDLRTKTRHKDNPTHRRLRENISWEAISDKLTTRNHKTCCLKWYNTLASPLVKQGIWADIDDYLLVEAIQKDDAVCIEDVDWDSLLDHRSGEVCRQRWNQMVRNIGGHREKPFIEQVEVLSKRYCREMLDYRK